MRPPQFAGEDPAGCAAGARTRHASMRPPQFAGEDLIVEGRPMADHGASMRPPQFAGEDAEYARLDCPVILLLQ